ncbi:basic proline-rich protein-like [Mustela putorius furo]|uniref:Basic proline-rich protein-like n=1 Tax=Mustela putorius furo TaxID=9669 RepID=A0A8U0V470_MUSPF|nr:basic proline-rich protein-like [Mustela putorius furo]
MPFGCARTRGEPQGSPVNRRPSPSPSPFQAVQPPGLPPAPAGPGQRLRCSGSSPREGTSPGRNPAAAEYRATLGASGDFSQVSAAVFPAARPPAEPAHDHRAPRTGPHEPGAAPAPPHAPPSPRLQVGAAPVTTHPGAARPDGAPTAQPGSRPSPAGLGERDRRPQTGSGLPSSRPPAARSPGRSRRRRSGLRNDASPRRPRHPGSSKRAAGGRSTTRGPRGRDTPPAPARQPRFPRSIASAGPSRTRTPVPAASAPRPRPPFPFREGVGGLAGRSHTPRPSRDGVGSRTARPGRGSRPQRDDAEAERRPHAPAPANGRHPLRAQSPERPSGAAADGAGRPPSGVGRSSPARTVGVWSASRGAAGRELREPCDPALGPARRPGTSAWGWGEPVASLPEAGRAARRASVLPAKRRPAIGHRIGPRRRARDAKTRFPSAPPARPAAARTPARPRARCPRLRRAAIVEAAVPPGLAEQPGTASAAPAVLPECGRRRGPPVRRGARGRAGASRGPGRPAGPGVRRPAPGAHRGAGLRRARRGVGLGAGGEPRVVGGRREAPCGAPRGGRSWLREGGARSACVRDGVLAAPRRRALLSLLLLRNGPGSPEETDPGAGPGLRPGYGKSSCGQRQEHRLANGSSPPKASDGPCAPRRARRSRGAREGTAERGAGLAAAKNAAGKGVVLPPTSAEFVGSGGSAPGLRLRRAESRDSERSLYAGVSSSFVRRATEGVLRMRIHRRTGRKLVHRGWGSSLQRKRIRTPG